MLKTFMSSNHAINLTEYLKVHEQVATLTLAGRQEQPCFAKLVTDRVQCVSEASGKKRFRSY
jgi:hypothetical protein